MSEFSRGFNYWALDERVAMDTLNAEVDEEACWVDQEQHVDDEGHLERGRE